MQVISIGKSRQTGILLHANSPFVNGPETKGKPRAAELMALRPRGRRKAVVLAKVADSNAVGVAI